MNWTNISIKVNREDCETASAIANMVVPYGIYVEDYSDLETAAWEIAHIDLIDEELLKKDRDSVIIHIYISCEDNAEESFAYLNERLIAAGIKAEVTSVGVDDADWSENWKKYFKAFAVGEHLAVCPSWEEYDNREERVVLKIDPGAAFGTGSHATTSMCLSLLDKYINGSETILDIGCGSGILAIASVLLGAESAVGVDIDAQSVKVSKENADINGIADKTEFICGDLTDKVNGKFDVVCANIVADIIIKLTPDVAAYMKDDALFMCSGIIDLRADEVRKALLDNGFLIVEEVVKDNWHAFAVRKVK